MVDDNAAHILRRANSVQNRMNLMRAKFQTLQVDDDNDPDGDINTPAPLQTNNSLSAVNRSISEKSHHSSQKIGEDRAAVADSSVSNKAGKLWGKLRKVIQVPDTDPTLTARRSSIVPDNSISMSNGPSSSSLELEDIQLMDYWSKIEEKISVDLGDNEQKDAVDAKAAVEGFPDLTAVQAVFVDESKGLSVTVSRVPERMLQEKQDQAERDRMEQQRRAIEDIKRKETDVLWRENLARLRMQDMETAIFKQQRVEKQKLFDRELERERDLGKEFRRVREQLELGIRRQFGALQEAFGKLIAQEASFSRRFFVSSRLVPQPIEVRVHLMRAVKTKLRKGNYVVMLTQFDSLGGLPLSWTRIGISGIGVLRPGITRQFSHRGRFFDRTVRIEDSCFALCPARPLLRPSFVFVLEVFELASKMNPTDRVVGWTAVPMCYENMTLVEGKLKLPLLRGEHSKKVQHFKNMERNMANDLSNWICNIYIEVRHVSLEELGVDETLLKSTALELDYFNKQVQVDSDSGGGPGAVEEAEADGKTGLPKMHIEQKPEEAEESRRLDVDKGLFRRKPQPAKEAASFVKTNTKEAVRSRSRNSSDDEDGGRDIEAGPRGGGRGGFFSFAFGSGKQHVQPISEQQSSQSLSGLIADERRVKQLNTLPVLAEAATLTLEGVGEKEDGEGQEGGGRDGNKGPASSSGQQQHAHERDDFRLIRGKDAKGGPAVRGKYDDFRSEQKQLVRQWRESVMSQSRSKQRLRLLHSSEPDDGGDDDDGDGDGDDAHSELDRETIVTIERGYAVKDEALLHPQQRGKLAGVEAIDGGVEAREWAAAGLEGKIVRKWQSEGSRFDSEAIAETRPREKLPSPSQRSAAAAAADRRADLYGDGWVELRDAREMDSYSMSIASDPSQRRQRIPGDLARSKLRYLTLEMFGDLESYMFGSFEFYMTLIIYVFAFWFRIYIHYLTGYLFLLAVGVPLYNFQLSGLQIQFKYMSASISSTSIEVALVLLGPMGNIVLFGIFALIGAAVYKFLRSVPRVASNFLSAYGLATVLDPLLTFLVDVGYHNYNCGALSSACSTSYVSSSCVCFNGDFVKLWYRMTRIEGSGITGAFITLLLYLGCGVLSLLMLYEYLVQVHRDGRVLDIWRRINANAEEFFLPHDFEVSADELQDAIQKARSWRGPPGYRRMLITRLGDALPMQEAQPPQPEMPAERKYFIIQEMEPSGRRSIFRQFYREEATGCIIEIFKEVDATQSSVMLKPRSIFDNDRAMQQMQIRSSNNSSPIAAATAAREEKQQLESGGVGTGLVAARKRSDGGRFFPPQDGGDGSGKNDGSLLPRGDSRRVLDDDDQEQGDEAGLESQPLLARRRRD